MPVRQHAQYEGSVTRTPEWKAAIINVLSYTCVWLVSMPTVRKVYIPWFLKDPMKWALEVSGKHILLCPHTARVDVAKKCWCGER